MKYVNSVFLFLSLFIFSSCGITEQDPDSLSNRILYSAEVNGKLQIFSINPNGSDKRQITSGKYWHDNVKCSLNGKTMICATEEGSTTAGISMAVMNSDGSNRRLVGNLWGYQLSLSPDGKMIAYSFMPMAEFGERSIYIYLCDINGNNNHRLTSDINVRETSPVWSTDGKRVYFSSNRQNPSSVDAALYFVDLSDSANEMRRVAQENSIHFYSAAISRDGTEIASVSNDTTTSIFGIYIMNIDGTNLRHVISPSKNEAYNIPSWSSDGKQIAFICAMTDGSQKFYLYMVNEDGSNLHRVTNESTVNSCDWLK